MHSNDLETLKFQIKIIRKLFEKKKIKKKQIQNCKNFNFKKHVNRDSHIAFSAISQSSFFEKVCCLILDSSQKKLYEYIEILKFDITIKKLKNLN